MMIRFIVGVFVRLFTFLSYVLLIPFHLIAWFIVSCLAVIMMFVDLPIWILTGVGFATSDKLIKWSSWHLGRFIP